MSSSKLANPAVFKFYLGNSVLVRFQLLFSRGRFFLFLDLESVEEKIMIGDLSNKLNYSYMLICSLSHELFTPLNHLINCTETLTRLCDKQKAIDPEVKNEVKLLRCLTEGLSIFVQNTLDFGRYINNSLRMEPAPFQLREAIDSMMELFFIKAKRKKLDINVSCPDMVIQTDRTKLIGLLFIFLDNSLKYTPRGGVSIKVKPGRSSEFLRFEIVDTGVGITPEDLKKLASIVENPFLDVRTQGAAGIGIGFRVAQVLLLCLAAGDIFFDIISQKGQGTTISFDILKTAKINTATESDFKSAIKKTITRALEDETSKREFDVDRVVLKAAEKFKNTIKPTVASHNGSGKTDDCNHMIISRDLSTPHRSAHFSDIQTELHQYPLYHNSPMLIGRVGVSRIKRIVQASIFLKTSSPVSKRGSAMLNKYLGDNFTNRERTIRERSKLSHQADAIDISSGLDVSLESDDMMPPPKVALVVDDEILNTEFLQNYLEGFGFEVYTAHDGDLAIEQCMKLMTCYKKIDIIFMDFSMPSMNGDVCARTLRKPMFDSILKGTKIVGVTAHFDPYTKKTCLEAGMDSVEKKPFSYNDIQRILREFNLLEPAENSRLHPNISAINGNSYHASLFVAEEPMSFHSE